MGFSFSNGSVLYNFPYHYILVYCFVTKTLQVAIEEESEEDEGTSSEEEKVKTDVNKETEKVKENEIKKPKKPKNEPKVIDIEETVADLAMEQKKLDKLK